jgi:phage-related protein
MMGFSNSLLSAGVSGAKRATNAVKNAITGAFSGAASWLTSAGRRIIDGLVSGIQGGFDRVRGLLSTLTGMLPDWKGPAEVDSRILEPSGDMVMAGFERGLQGRFSSIKKTLGEMTADLPAWSGGAPRGGDGAALSGGGMNVTIQAGAIVVQGQGREAGEEAAEAILERLGAATLAR